MSLGCLRKIESYIQRDMLTGDASFLFCTPGLLFPALCCRPSICNLISSYLFHSLPFSLYFYFCLSPSFPFSHLVHLFIIVYIPLSFSLSVSISLLPILSLSLSLSLFLPLSSGIPISFSRYIHIKICITRHRFFLLHHLFLSPTSFPLSIFVSIYQIHEIKLTVSLFHSLPFKIHNFGRSLKTFLLLEY